MKKSLLTLSTLALFAGAAMADGSFTKIWSVDNQDSYTVAAGDYIRAEGYYYNTTGEQHRGPVYNVGTMTIDGIFESYVDASAQSMLGAQKVLGNGELRINSALFLSPDTDFSALRAMSTFNAVFSGLSIRRTRPSTFRNLLFPINRCSSSRTATL